MKDLLMKYYKDEDCPVCSEKFKENDEIVVCPDCGTPYHKSCYKKNNVCLHESEHGSYFYTNDKIENLKNNFSQNQISQDQINQDIEGLKDFGDFRNYQEKIECPYCGTLNSIENKECENCKMPLDIAGPKAFFYKGKFFGNQKFQNEKISGIPIKDWISYLGINWFSYIFKFKSIEKRKYSLLEYNWGALFFRGFYFLYRKMYWVAGLIWLLEFLLIFFVWSTFLPEDLKLAIAQLAQVNVFQGVFVSTGAESSQMFNSVLEKLMSFLVQNPQVQSYIGFGQFVLSVLSGAVATRIYKKISEKKINSIKKDFFKDEASYRNALAKKGSVNYFAPFVILLLGLYLL